MKKILKIALEKVNYVADKLYSYYDESECDFSVGQRVLVPFGVSNSKRLGIILEIEDAEAYSQNMKSVYCAIDEHPIINFEIVNLIKWIKSKYFCTYFDALRLILPSGIGGNTGQIIYECVQNPNLLNADTEEKNFLDLIKKTGKDKISLKEISSLKIRNYSSVLERLISKGFVRQLACRAKTVGRRKIGIFSICDGYESQSLRSENQKKVFEFLQKNPKSTFREISYFTGATQSVVNSLVKKGVLICEKIEKYVSPEYENLYDFNPQKTQDLVLNDEQSEAYKKIVQKHESEGFCVSLLHGVTGSGKTSVMINLIDYVLRLGKTAIFMVPEIALTSQFVNLFMSRYGSDVAVVHSSLTDWQRYDMWQKIKAGDIKIVIGTRSAVFAPLENLGLIIIDEEHEFTYKSEFSPRYDTREVAAYRCKNSKGMVVLSSATPSLESYYLAKLGKYNLCELKNRYGAAKIPNVEILDMNEFNLNSGINPLSEKLIGELKNTLMRQEQAILLVNRRGFNTLAKCSDCGEIAMCPNCSVSLSYHEANKRLMCHHCGYSAEKTKKCSYCGKEKLVYFGFGTQKIELILQERLPGVRILRLDSDTKNCKGSVGAQLKDFERGKYDILLGTQMVSKGFNFPNVTLVGVVSVDQSLCDSDFKSFEKAFALVSQVIGRAGRMEKSGKAFLQTLNPENEIIGMSASQDYKLFYESEIAIRKAMLNPPFCDICVLALSGKVEQKVVEASNFVFELFKKIASESYPDIPLRVYPPSEAKIKMISKNYRYKIVIKCKNNSKFRDLVNSVIEEFYGNKECKSISIFPWINPDTIL